MDNNKVSFYINDVEILMDENTKIGDKFSQPGLSQKKQAEVLRKCLLNANNNVRAIKNLIDEGAFCMILDMAVRGLGVTLSMMSKITMSEASEIAAKMLNDPDVSEELKQMIREMPQ